MPEISKAKFATLVSVSPAAVTKACKNGLAAAWNGHRINTDHPDAAAYLAKRQGVPTPPPPPPKAERVVSGSEARRRTKKDEALDNIGAKHAPDPNGPLAPFYEYTIREILQKFGTDTAFVDWLKALKTLEEVETKRLANAQKRGDLISREVVQRGVVDSLDSAFRRMLTDGARTIATRCNALSKAGAPPEEIEQLVVKQLSSFIKPAKAKIQRVTLNA